MELAKRVGESQSVISKCECGERRIDVVELRQFCRAFGLSLKQFAAALERTIEARRRTR